MNFSDRLKKIIKISGLKREDFSKIGGISRTQLFRYLSGEQEPSSSFYRNIKSNLPWVNLDWLILGDGEPEIKPEPNKIVPIDPAVRILNEVLSETGVDLNPAQREAVIKILRQELAKSEGNTKGSIKDWIAALTKDADDG